MAGNFINIDASLRSAIEGAFDDMITQFPAPCLLVYPPKIVICTNCGPSPVGATSNNVWRTGGPMPFGPSGICPMCGGTSKITSEVSEAIVVKAEWEPKNFSYPIAGLDIRIPNNVVQIKGFLTDLPKVQKADHFVVQGRQYKLYGEAIDKGVIIRSRYFYAFLRRS